ncbi:MAG: pyrroline-5-carboxylate reductase [Clostridiales bacterium]
MSGTLGFLGFGNMGKAIAQGLVKAGALKASSLVVYDIAQPAVQSAKELGAVIADSEQALCEGADYILLAVKPNVAQGALKATGGAASGKALLSIVAGVDHKSLLEWAGTPVRILRIMPNTPALVSAGVFGFSLDTTLTQAEQETVVRWFSEIGLVEWVGEELMDAVTGLSGGAPAYVAMFVEALADGGVQQGLKREAAYRLAAQTVLGTAKLILDTGMHPAAVKDAVCFPGGTTIEGILALERNGMRAAVADAVVSSSEKSKRLNKH